MAQLDPVVLLVSKAVYLVAHASCRYEQLEIKVQNLMFKKLLTFFDHANRQAFLITTILTAIASPFINWTVLIGQTNVFSVLLDSSLKEELETLICAFTHLEEAFASFTGANTIMLTCGRVTAHGTESFVISGPRNRSHVTH